MKNYHNSYYDDGDFSILIKRIEKNYTSKKAEYYDKGTYFMADIIYIYDRIPFLSTVRSIVNSKDDLISSSASISRVEIEEYIIENHVSTISKDDFKLYDENTWII